MDVETVPTCYRHSDRETRLSCSACGRPVCVDCVRPAAVGQKCPECAAPTGRSRVITADQIATVGTGVTRAVIGICVAVFLAQLVIPSRVELFGAQINQAIAQGEWWRVFTAAFLHSRGFIFHIVLNLWVLWSLGPPLERQVGSVPYAGLLAASAAGGGAAFYVLGPLGGVAVGASGMIFGLFGAWVAASLRARHTLGGRAQLNRLLVLVGINLALPLFIGRIAWEAHVGGLVTGFLVALAWGAVPGDRRQGRVARTAIALGFAAVAVVLTILA